MLAAVAVVGGALFWVATTSVPHLSSRGQISAIEFAWWPDPPGPGPAPRLISDGPAFQRAVAEVPVPLPRLDFDLQQCHVGVYVTLRLTNGKTVMYGPCRRPASIDRVLAVLESG